MRYPDFELVQKINITNINQYQPVIVNQKGGKGASQPKSKKWMGKNPDPNDSSYLSAINEVASRPSKKKVMHIRSQNNSQTKKTNIDVYLNRQTATKYMLKRGPSVQRDRPPPSAQKALRPISPHRGTNPDHYIQEKPIKKAVLP